MAPHHAEIKFGLRKSDQEQSITEIFFQVEIGLNSYFQL